MARMHASPAADMLDIECGNRRHPMDRYPIAASDATQGALLVSGTTGDRSMRNWLRYSMLGCGILLAACSSTPVRPALQPVAQVDLQRYMGRWYVLAHIPAAIEKGAFNAVETYRLTDKGEVDTTFTFRRGSFEGTEKTYRPTGFIVDPASNSAEDYTQTIVARNKRDYVWIMARTPRISERDYIALTEKVRSYGYDLTRLRKVPQRWP
jgi:apolipoprotein D and lipocalin family protein